MSYVEIAATAPQKFRRNRLRLGPVLDPEDLIALVDACSEESLFLRFHTGMSELRPTMAKQLAKTPGLGLWTAGGDLVADARYTRSLTGEYELSILIADDYQGRGLGSALLSVLLVEAADEGIESLVADVLASNDPMLALLAKMGPVESLDFEDSSRRLSIQLTPVAVAA